MRTRMEIPFVALVAALALAGCQVEDSPDDATLPAEENAPALEPGDAAPGTGATTDAVALGIDSLPGAGAYLTDGEGRALYLLEADPEGESTCYEACAEEWPPLLAGTASASARTTGLREDLIDTTERRDGSLQVTYGGHPLYYYHDDQGAGQTEGQDVTDRWGEWYLVQPTGEALEEGGEGAS